MGKKIVFPQQIVAAIALCFWEKELLEVVDFVFQVLITTSREKEGERLGLFPVWPEDLGSV